MSKRKLWTNESMKAAVAYVNDGNAVCEAARLYNVPVETLCRRVIGTVDLACKPGPSTILTVEEEDCLAYVIISKSGRSHPFQNGMAGRAWIDGFRKRHPQITLCSPQPLSFCRAMMANMSVVDNFFAKLGALYGRVNLINKPMQVFNIDETGNWFPVAKNSLVTWANIPGAVTYYRENEITNQISNISTNHVINS